MFDVASKVATRLKHLFTCKSVMSSFESMADNVNFGSVPVCQRVNAVKSVYCNPDVYFLANPFFTTVNLVRPVTIQNLTPLNSAHHFRRVFPSVRCPTSIPMNFSYQRHKNVTSFPLHGFIQAILMSGRRLKKFNLLIEFSNTIFIKKYFKAYWC